MDIICSACKSKLGVLAVEIPFTMASTCGLCGHVDGHSCKLVVEESAASQPEAVQADSAGPVSAT